MNSNEKSASSVTPDRIRIAVTGTRGQLANTLRERAAAFNIEVIALGRPELDLENLSSVMPALAGARAQAVVNAAAYTAVDQAEREPAVAHAVNTLGAGEVAAAAHKLGLPILHLSTDYVFDGEKPEPYLETDYLRPVNAYGRSKAAGEILVAARAPNHVILRTEWVYSPFGKNFVRTILHLAQTRDALDIVADQHGAPTSAFDVADSIVKVVRNLLSQPEEDKLRGVFHLTSAGTTTWAEFAEAVFEHSLDAGGPFAAVRRISSKDYPQAAKRPANSRLDCARIAEIHGVRLADWHASVRPCVERLLGAAE